MQIALYQPDIPQNLGSILRLCACMGVVCHIIEPCGFLWDDKRIRRVAMDYIDHVQYHRHASWEAFVQQMGQQGRRIVLLTTKASGSYCDYAFQSSDVLLLGRESAGVPQDVADRADAQLRIPLVPPMRSLNVALAVSMVLGEALRQTKMA